MLWITNGVINSPLRICRTAIANQSIAAMPMSRLMVGFANSCSHDRSNVCVVVYERPRKALPFFLRITTSRDDATIFVG